MLVERAGSFPKTVLQPLRPTKVAKRPPTQQKNRPTLPSGILSAGGGRPPSEEDLYFLLLHRYRTREQSDKQLTARLQQLEIENKNLVQEAHEYQQQVKTCEASSSKKAVQFRRQEMLMNDIKDAYLKIKNFMKDVLDEQKILKAKASSLDRDRQAVRNEQNQIRFAVEETKNVVTTSDHTIQSMKSDLAGLRREAAYLETSLRDAKLELKHAQIDLRQERQRNTRYEHHIADITQKQNMFSSTIQQAQQQVLGALKNIKGKLNDLETDNLGSDAPTNIPALNQCVEMLKALSDVETASPADVSDVVEAMLELSKRYASSLQTRVIY